MSRLVWDERAQAPHAGVLELYRTLLRLRRTEAAMRTTARFDVTALDEACLAVTRGAGERDTLLLVLCASPSRRVDLGRWRSEGSGRRWKMLLTTEDSRFQESADSGAMPGPRSSWTRGSR